MIVLSVLVYLPAWAVTTFGVVMIATHNLFDFIRSDNPLWTILHSPNVVYFGARATQSSSPIHSSPGSESLQQAMALVRSTAGRLSVAEPFFFVLASPSLLALSSFAPSTATAIHSTGHLSAPRSIRSSLS